MKTYRVRKSYTQHYYADIQASSYESACEIADELDTHDCKQDEYSSWEVYSVDELWNVYAPSGELIEQTYSKEQAKFALLFYKQQTGLTATFKKVTA
jgi:hypothetical protein